MKEMTRQWTLSIALAVACLTTANELLSEEITFSYNARLIFDPDLVVGTNGETARVFFDEFLGSGVGEAGEVSLAGSFSWDTTTPALNRNSDAAGYTNAITGATVVWDGVAVSADIAEIQANALSSTIGWNTDAGSFFCGTADFCSSIGQPFTPTGNVIQIADDANFNITNLTDGTSEFVRDRDFVGFLLGFTDSQREFTPVVATPSFGTVAVGAVASSFTSNASAAINENLDIPSSENFLNFDDLDQATLSIEFNSSALLDGQLGLQGVVTGFSVVASLCNGLSVTVDLSRGDAPTSGPDVIMGTVGNDIINSLGGDDTVCGLAGNDTINAGNGNDWVDAGPGNDTVEGGNGDDEIYGDTGVDIINGGPDNDELFGEGGGDFINGNSGNDLLDGGFGIDQLRGGAGNDVINTGSGGNRGSGLVVTGGAGNDIITGGPGTDEIRGESGNDTILGGDAGDSLFGGGGNDIVNGQDGNDILRGNGGKDTLSGGDGNDDMDGGSSDDIMSGGNGNDDMRGATGNDDMSGGAGDDEIFGGGGSDVITGNRGDDTLSGGGSNDTLNGGSDEDSCRGDGGTDSAVSCESQASIP